MLGKVLKKVFGSKNEREIKRIQPIVDAVGALEPKMKELTDADFPALTARFKEDIASGKTLDDILPEAFAAVREVAWRTLGMRHFDVQLIGGVVLHEGNIAEMKTGEGKTLMATLPMYLNALTGKGAHLVTVNDYLARRDARWMGAVYHALGMSVAIIQHEASLLYDPEHVDSNEAFMHLRPVTRREAYRADITYGTNNEYGFDYLRDNMKFTIEEYVQREFNFAIVDEVDSILIDEARTPLIISGPTEESTDKYYKIDKLVPSLKKDLHYTVDEKARQVLLTDEGVEAAESLLKVDNLYDPSNIETLHHLYQGLKAHVLFSRDVDYVVTDGKVVIVDEFTGRLMPGRRWSEGLHQAVEAKEGVEIENENQTLASITFQNYFRMYDKLAGMTGTAETEAEEFLSIYGLDVMVIPTNKPLIRNDMSDLVYKTKKDKFAAAIQEITDCHNTGVPVLVGTISIDDSEKLSVMLKQHGIPHHTLNAKQHDREAEYVAQAGRLGAVTISTNMAGRGTDILLGGNPVFLAAEEAGKDDTTPEYKAALERYRVQCEQEKQKVLELGGLYILGTERHESRRIDNQLRGRAGRQGDPGKSRFFMSLEDDLMRIFGSDRIASIMDRIGMEEGVPIEHGLVSKAIANAQKKVEGHNFDIRKHLLEYDDVMNQQREVVYGYRKQILSREALRDMVREFSDEVAEDITETYTDDKSDPKDWDATAIGDAVMKHFGVVFGAEDMLKLKNRTELPDAIVEKGWAAYNEKVAFAGEEAFSDFEKVLMLHTLDTMWKDHLLSMDHLKSGVGLRGYGQKNPLQEYKREGYDLFVDMINRFKAEVVERLYRVQITMERPPEEVMPAPKEQPVTLGRGAEPAVPLDDAALESDDFEAEEAEEEEAHHEPMRREGEKVGRNDPCPCGSGKKYKKCCGANA